MSKDMYPGPFAKPPENINKTSSEFIDFSGLSNDFSHSLLKNEKAGDLIQVILNMSEGSKNSFVENLNSLVNNKIDFKLTPTIEENLKKNLQKYIEDIPLEHLKEIGLYFLIH